MNKNVIYISIGIITLLVLGLLIFICKGNNMLFTKVSKQSNSEVIIKDEGVNDNLPLVFEMEASDYKVSEFLNLLQDKPKLYSDDTCYNITPKHIREKYNFNIFKFNQSCASYLLYDNKIYTLGESFGGYGVVSFAIADINNDNNFEIYYSYSSGSGIHRSNIGYFDSNLKETKVLDFINLENDVMFEINDSTIGVYKADINAKSFIDISVNNSSKKQGNIINLGNQIVFTESDK